MTAGRPPLPGSQLEREYVQLIEEELSRQLKGLTELREHFAIEPRVDGMDWLVLCLSLARRAVPYFQPKVKSRGNPKFWTDDRLFEFWYAVELEHLSGRRPLTSALSFVIRSTTYPYAGRKLTVTTAQQLHKRAQRLLRREEYLKRANERLTGLPPLGKKKKQGLITE
jgi:hypothetical protein